MRLLVAILLPIVLAACAGPFPYRETVAGEKFSAAELRRCEKLGGKIEQIGFVSSTCVYPAPDSGKKCGGYEDCAGRCDAPVDTPQGTATSGTCSALVGPVGCANIVVNGKATGFLCAD